MLVFGMGTIPGSDRTALKCDTVIRKTIVLKTTAQNAPQNLQQRSRCHTSFIYFTTGFIFYKITLGILLHLMLIILQMASCLFLLNKPCHTSWLHLHDMKNLPSGNFVSIKLGKQQTYFDQGHYTLQYWVSEDKQDCAAQWSRVMRKVLP